jgi:hypothetical protein
VEIRRGVIVLTLLVLAGCGTSHHRSSAAEWSSSATVVIDQLRGDVLAVAGTDRVPVARAALANDSQLYGLLVAFSDVAGCGHMVATLGLQPARFVTAERLLTRACGPLGRAGALFTKATTRADPQALVAAVREAATALPFLDRARLALGTR